MQFILLSLSGEANSGNNQVTNNINYKDVVVLFRVFKSTCHRRDAVTECPASRMGQRGADD